MLRRRFSSAAGWNPMDPIFDAEFKRGFAQAMKHNPQLTPEVEAQARETSRKFVPVFVVGYAFFAPGAIRAMG